MSEEQPKKVVFEISITSVLKVILVFAALWVLFLVRDILLILLVVLLITVALEPYVTKLEQEKVPRALSVIVLYLALLVVLGLLLYFVIPPVANQVKELTFNFPYYTSRLSDFNIGDFAPISGFLNSISSRLSDVAGGVLGALVSVFGGIAFAIIIFALTFYALVDGENIKKSLISIIPTNKKDRLRATIVKVSEKLSDWMRGQLLLMLIIGVVDGSILAIMGIKYALTLGLLAGLFEIIPVLGPILSAIAAALVAFILGAPLWKVGVILAAYIIVQQLEGYILVPKIMQKAIGMSPIVVIIAILIGNKLLGLGGALLAVPVAAGIQVFVKEYFPLGKS